jgi:AAA family ATP:ADP antiporter
MVEGSRSEAAGWRERVRARIVALEPGELGAVLWSFTFFFAVLSSYYVIRPLRDEMGVAVGPDGLKYLFLVVFLVMLAAVPVFGWVVATFPRRRVAPIVYVFFTASLLVFWTLLDAGPPGFWLAAGFFVFVSVFNLFVVSLFWSVMADVWSSDAARRVYGFIAAGGSIGALAGPLITQSLVHRVGPANLLAISAALLAVAMVCITGLRGALAGGGPGSEKPAGSRLVEGAMRVLGSPYLGGIAIWVLLANLISTLFYVEQARIVGASITSQADRVQLFARMDLAVSLLTTAAQVLLTGPVLARLGVGLCAAALPASAAVGLAAIALSPTLSVVIAVIVIERAIGFAFANPAVRVLYTVVEPDEKYTAQNFVDTVVFRGGDAASVWLFNGLVKGLGMSTAAVAGLMVPFALAWVGLSLALGRMQSARAAGKRQASGESASG